MDSVVQLETLISDQINHKVNPVKADGARDMTNPSSLTSELRFCC